jgi:hypothetical protein
VKNRLGIDDNELANLDYSNILKQILACLKTENPFSFSQDGQRLELKLDDITTKLLSKKLESPLSSAQGIKSASINFSILYGDKFTEQIREIRDRLNQNLQQATPANFENVEQVIQHLLSDLQSFQDESQNIDFIYPFQEHKNLLKQRLSLKNNHSKSESLLKLHKATITVQEITEIQAHLKISLTNYVKQQFSYENEDVKEELGELLEEFFSNSKSDFYKLIKVIEKEVVGKLKREVKVRYLEYIWENIPNDKPERIYLQELKERLRLVENYINRIDLPDAHYQVNYQGVELNYRTTFADANAFDLLPIIPIINGYLGETTDEQKGEKSFIFGLKMKLDNFVNSQEGESKNVLDYFLDFLEPNLNQSKSISLSKKEKILKIAYLYYFVFTSERNPVSRFEERFLPYLKGSNQEDKQEALIAIKDKLKEDSINDKIKRIKSLLQSFLKQKTILEPKEYPVFISLKKGLLEKNLERILRERTFFKSVFKEKSKEYLQYLIIQESQIDQNSLCQIPVSLIIEDIRYYPTNEQQSFNLSYAIDQIKVLPLLIAPVRETNCNLVYQKNFKKNKIIVLSYNHENLKKKIFNTLDNPQIFFYRFIYSLLAYLCIKVILKYISEPKKLFIPIMRLHLHEKDTSEEEKFMRSLSKVLSHLLNEECLSNSQGFRINEKNTEKFRINNSKSSLYSLLPKTFTIQNSKDYPELDKMIIFIVSSWECDKSYRSERKVSNLLGEIIKIENLGNGQIKFTNFKSFSANLLHDEIYQNPLVIIDQIERCYQDGFRHFLYLAKAPYSSQLNIIDHQDQDDSLFFLSKSVIKQLKGEKKDIKIYPIFFDKYYTVKLQNIKNSLYIQDTLELTRLVEDLGKKSVVFFNLFNGVSIGKKEERFYNGVISYTTLLNVYDGILDDEDLRKGLIQDSSNNQLKNDILQYLSFFHFSRYEKSSQINFKLDPYTNIIGEDSVSQNSLFNHTIKSVQFNLLAFLTEVRRAFNV